MLKCLLKYHFVRLFHVASGSSHKSYKGGHHSEDQATEVSQDRGQEGRGHFNRSQEGSSMRVRGTYPCPLVCNMSGLFTLCNHSVGQENMLSSTTLCPFGWDLRIDRKFSWELFLCSFWLPFRAMVFSRVSVPQGYGSCVVWLKQLEQWCYWYIPVGGQGCIRHHPQKGESA